MNPNLPILREATLWLAAVTLMTGVSLGTSLAVEALVMGALCLVSLAAHKALAVRFLAGVEANRVSPILGWLMINKLLVTVGLVWLALTQLSGLGILLGWLPLLFTTLSTGMRLFWNTPSQNHSRSLEA